MTSAKAARFSDARENRARILAAAAQAPRTD
jgi:hypothetical protein